jgi:hypothetical protein
MPQAPQDPVTLGQSLPPHKVFVTHQRFFDCTVRPNSILRPHHKNTSQGTRNMGSRMVQTSSGPPVAERLL